MDKEIERLIWDCDALLFDCDGTLIDSASLHCEAFRLAFASHGIEMTPDWYYARVGLDCHGIVADTFAAHGKALDVDATAEEVERLYLSLLGDVQTIEDVAALARRWSRRKPMAVVSNGQRAGVEASLQAVDLLRFFDTVVCADDGLPLKPAPDMYVQAAKLLKVRVCQCVVFEDSKEGIASGQSAGARVVDVNAWLAKRKA